ncbi:hypothetical protein DJ031_16090 [bacterium endosymbiont of Escarpia laminata]|nr:MAG: hypothetical protein DJ031_16090 [bacterium endosymbiont of Escarpia laminata]
MSIKRGSESFALENGQEGNIMRIGIITLTLSTALLFSTAGFADDSSVDLDQSGNDNTFTIIQDGPGASLAVVTQNGDHNDVAIHQTSFLLPPGAVSAYVLQQDNSEATATITQSGNAHTVVTQANSTNVTVTVNQHAGDGFGELRLYQEGQGLVFQADMNGEGHSIFASGQGRGQFGTNNTARLAQQFQDADIFFRQEGDSNLAELTQSSIFGRIEFDQRGNLNTTRLVESGGGPFEQIRQSGTSNLIDLVIDSDAKITIDQSGTFNELSGIVNLNLTPPKYSIQQSGNLNLITLNVNNWSGAFVGSNILMQTGDNGVMSLTQDGAGLSAALTQTGIGNSMDINQTGTSSHIEVTQN